MNPTEIVAAVEERGGIVSLRSDGKVIVSPGSALTPKLREVLTASRDAVAAMLAAPDLADDAALLRHLVELAGGKSDAASLAEAAGPLSSGMAFFCEVPECRSLGTVPGFVERYTEAGEARCRRHQEPWPPASPAYLAQIGL